MYSVMLQVSLCYHSSDSVSSKKKVFHGLFGQEGNLVWPYYSINTRLKLDKCSNTIANIDYLAFHGLTDSISSLNDDILPRIVTTIWYMPTHCPLTRWLTRDKNTLDDVVFPSSSLLSRTWERERRAKFVSTTLCHIRSNYLDVATGYWPRLR